MHASFYFIKQILQLAYTTQACILNLKTYAMQASTWLCTYQMQPIKVLVLILLSLSWASNFDLTKLICLNFQVRFEPMTSFFTPLTWVILQCCTCHLLAIQIKSSTWVYLAHEQIHILTTRSINHSSNSGRLWISKIFICHAWS